MKILDFLNINNLASKSEMERAKFLCYYHFKKTNENAFTMSCISDLMVNAGFSTPNTSRLKTALTKGKGRSFLMSKVDRSSLGFVPVVLQEMEATIGLAWTDTTAINSKSELIDEVKFCDKRPYLDRLIKQINHSYAHNCYDACAVLLRRLFEVLLVLSYQHFNIDDEIKDHAGTGYIMLEKIVANAKNNKILKLSRIKNEFDTFRSIGNFSAHGITYTAGKKDIDDIKLNYRVMLEELFNKAGLMK